jgi:hypothetical protein
VLSLDDTRQCWCLAESLLRVFQSPYFAPIFGFSFPQFAVDSPVD